MLAESANTGMSAEQVKFRGGQRKMQKKKKPKMERRPENIRTMGWNIKIRWKIKNTKGDITSYLKNLSQEIHVLSERGQWERTNLMACQL